MRDDFKKEYSQLTDIQKELVSGIKDDFQVLYDEINSEVSDCREKSICLTHLQDACMWIIRAVTEKDFKRKQPGEENA